MACAAPSSSALSPEPSAALYHVGVRQLCEFTAKAGDLDLRFTPSPSAQEGIAGHQAVATRRAAGYQREVRVEATYRQLRVQGRIDGHDPARGLIEEVKTHRGPAAKIPANHRALHWAQAQMYGAMLCAQQGLPALQVAVVYFDVDTGQETPEVRAFDAAELHAFFEAQCERFLAWALQETQHRAMRDAALGALPWPYAHFPPGQRQLATAVYNAARSGRCLMAQAPTGSGKTIGTLFPMLKAVPTQRLDKVFFLTAKTSGRRQALEATAHLQRQAAPLPLRVIELVARDTACEHPDKACHGESCPLARGFYDRLPAAREAAVTHAEWDREALRTLATAHQICPYYLGQEMLRWSDVVVGDYNHYFDLHAVLHGLTTSSSWSVAVLVDEAHNLVERGRGMYTATLDQDAWRALRRTAPKALKQPFDRLHRAWNALLKDAASPYQVLGEVPDGLTFALKRWLAAIGEHVADAPEGVDSALLRFYFDALHFDRLADLMDEHSQFELTIDDATSGRRRPALTLGVRNIVPAVYLTPRFAAARSVVLFSATLAPSRYYLDLLGLPEHTALIDIDSPYSAEQLRVHTVRRLSTRYRDRAASIEPLADLIAERYRAAPGNYLAFFSSFAYLREVLQSVQQRHADVPTWAQQPGMSEADKDAFLARFEVDGRGVGFAVLGGAFGEAIDLPGTRLVGAFIATLGLPQVNAANEAIKERMQRLFGAGYDYTYLYPGLQKVVQAAGRVVRGPHDRGVVYLIDDRYARADVRALLPAWWAVVR